jgi:hypothetical protein
LKWIGIYGEDSKFDIIEWEGIVEFAFEQKATGSNTICPLTRMLILNNLNSLVMSTQTRSNCGHYAHNASDPNSKPS